MKFFHISFVGLTDRMATCATRGIKMASTEVTSMTVKTQDATKDAGRVKLGAGSIKFSDPTPTREATKDAGRVRMGAGSIKF
jgi:hypothetical protein